jgi:cob(I)alamin adenosyltransferase
MKIYTRQGDAGRTALLGGERVSKAHPRIEAYGTIDELNSVIGVVRASWPASPIDQQLEHVQNDLFDLGAHFAATAAAGRFPGVAAGRKEELEEAIDAMEAELEPLKNFILPGGSVAAAHIHVARTVCRRAERLIVQLLDAAAHDGATDENIAYLNRLSDYLFVAARYANRNAGVADVLWSARR